MIVLVINSGSSSIKFQVIRMTDRYCLCAGLLERIGQVEGAVTYEPSGKQPVRRTARISDHAEGIGIIMGLLVDSGVGVLSTVNEIAATGHRVVHGAAFIRNAELVTPHLEKLIEECAGLAPLHNPSNLLGIRAVRAALPSVPHVAVFDTAFHAGMPEESFLFALPYAMYEQHGIRKFGFHGTSHRFVTRRAAEILGIDPGRFNCVSCHLGNGVSFTAVKNGESVDTSLGFGTMSGVPMGTRAGDVDPAVVLHMIDALGMSTAQVHHLLYFESGLKGLSGRSSDMRDVSRSAQEGDPRALMAMKVFAHGARKHIAALATNLEGRLDALIFTAGIGEHSPESRALICDGLQLLGIRLDPEKNRLCSAEAVISSPGSRVPVLVVPTQEELMIAIETEDAVGRMRTGA
jgi:acetate kinase